MDDVSERDWVSLGIQGALAGSPLLGSLGPIASALRKTGDALESGGAIAKRAGRSGDFSVIGWDGYPDGLAKPGGPFRLLEGEDYQSARRAANRANAALRRANPSAYAGKQIHEIHPVKFGGSPTDPANKVALSPREHAEYTTFWNRLMRDLK